MTSLNILPRKREINVDVLVKKRKVAVKHSCSAWDQIPWRLVFDSFPFSSFHKSEGNRPFLSGERYFKSCVLVSAYVWLNFICSRKTNSTKKDTFFKEPKKASALAGLDTCGGGLMFLMSFIFCTVWVHRVHSISTTLVLRKGQKVYILPGVLNFQRVRDPLGLQLRSFHSAYFLFKTIIWLVTCIEYPLERCFAHRNSKHNYTS